MSPFLVLVPDAHSVVFKPEVTLSHLPSVFPRNIKHSKAVFAESHVKGLMSYCSSTLPQPGFSPPPLPTRSFAACVTGQPNPASHRLFGSGNSYCFG